MCYYIILYRVPVYVICVESNIHIHILYRVPRHAFFARSGAKGR